MKPDRIFYLFKKPGEADPETLALIENLIGEGRGVGTSWVAENLERAFLIGYAVHEGEIVGTSTHKYPKDFYRKRIEAATGLDLHGYLERGYTVVRPEYRGLGIGGRLIRGLIERSPGRKIYVTIRMDNIAPLKMTYREKMILAATFINERTGHELGLFVSHRPPLKGRT